MMSDLDDRLPDRDAMIEAAAKAIHDAGCGCKYGPDEHHRVTAAVVLDVVRPLILAEQRELFARVFVLDDGERLEFDRVELLSALGAEVAGDLGRLRAA